ncbi:hypothetical protein ACFL09_04220 [Planctomycetota bacterium]
MADLFDETRDKWQKSYRYPLYLRFLWLVSVGLVVATFVWQERLKTIVAQDWRIGWGVIAVIILVAVACIWKSIRAWGCKILISPTSIKAWYLLRGRDRISWDSMDRIVGKWRLLGHTILVIGTDGAKVHIGSSLSGYDELMGFIRDKAPAHIVQQIDEFLSDDEAEAEAPGEEADEPEDEEEEKDNAST